jgi:hypothetical protein
MIVFLFLLLMMSCGLDTVKYLNNPTVLTQSNDYLVSWTYNPANYAGTNFLGYELYYKFYKESAGANYGNNDVDLLKNAGGVPVVPTPERLLSLGYHRFNINEISLNSEPVISINPANLSLNLRFEVDFSPLLNSTLGTKENNPPKIRILNNFLNTVISETEIRRGVRSPNNTNFRRFWEVYDLILRSQQPNLESSLVTALTGSPSGLWVVLFVMSYGWSPENGREISEPVLLGTIKTLTLNW